MPKVEVIINELAKKCPNTLPEISQVFQSDVLCIEQALKEKGKPQDYYIFLRVLHSKVLKMLKSKDFLKPLLDINVSDLFGHLKIEALLYICEGIIDAEDQFRTTTIEKYIVDMSKMNLSNIQLARLEIVSAGNNFLKGDYVKSATQYLSASRMEAFVKDDKTKKELAQKAIAFAFISPISPQSHKIICTLCMNENVKKTSFFPLVSKLYRQDIFTKEEINIISDQLPQLFKEKDRDGVSIIEQSAFSRNMIPIINSFSNVKLHTLLRLSGVASEEQLLILLEKTYRCGEVSIDQIQSIVRINGKEDTSEVIKEFLNQIDTIINE